jgi:hypothetical protein
MGEPSPWEKLAALAEEVRDDPELQQVFRKGPAAKVLMLLHQRDFTPEDIQVLSQDVTNMSGLWLSVGRFWEP